MIGLGKGNRYWMGVAIHNELVGDLLVKSSNKAKKRTDELVCNGKLVRLLTLDGEKTSMYASKKLARKLQDEGICKTEPPLNGKKAPSAGKDYTQELIDHYKKGNVHTC